MKFNAACWRRPAAVLPIVTLLLTGCATGSSDLQMPCPPVVDYSAVDQIRAAAEIEAMSDNAVVVKMLSDYAVLRDQARACR